MIRDNLKKFKVEKGKNLRVTSRAGLGIIGSFAGQIGLFKRLEAGLRGLKVRSRGYRIYEKIFYLMGMLICGGERLMHMKVLESDRGMLELFGRKRVPRGNTMGYFLRRFRRREIKVLADINMWLVKRLIRSKGLRHITIDIDSTLIESDKREAKRTYKGFHGYNPLLAVIKEIKVVIRGVFREGNSSPGANNLSLLRLIYNSIKDMGLKRIYFRSDSAAYNWRIMGFCEGRGIYFGIGIRGTELMKRVIKAIPEDEWEGFGEGIEIAETVHFVGSDRYGGAYRVVVTRKRRKELALFMEYGYEYHGVITNINHWDKKAVMRWYNKRGDMENVIKELKYDYGMDKIPTGELLANSAYFQIVLLAYNLMRAFSLCILPSKWRRYRLKTIRFIFINIGGVIRKHARYIRLILPENYPYFDTFYYSRYKALNAHIYI